VIHLENRRHLAMRREREGRHAFCSRSLCKKGTSMISKKRTLWTTMSAGLTALCFASACHSPDEPSATGTRDGPNESVDALRTVHEHGALAFPSWTPTTLSQAEPVHAWTFELSAAASIALRTEASSEGDVDTVLSLYREGPRGWGPAIARNDDVADSVLSALSRRLKAGRYRVVAKGYDARSIGTFILASECDGAGCPRSAPECLFGASFYELVHGEGREVTIASEEQITSAAQLHEDIARSQLVLAVQQSSHTDVATAAEALARVDQQTVRRLLLVDLSGERTYTAYEYGAGDNSYGAIFVEGTLDIAASIHDGDFLNCTALQRECLLPTTYANLRADRTFRTEEHALLESGALSRLTPAQRTQLLATLRINYLEADAPTLEDALGLADGGTVQMLRVRHVEHGLPLVVYEHGAGDTSVGAVFVGDEPGIRAVISDGSFERCSLFTSSAR
jgi:hypothetical protein